MRKHWKTLMTTAAVLAALAGGPAWYAYAESSSPHGSGGMMQDGQGGMMGMMDRMGQMTPNSRSSGGMMQGGQGGMPNMMGMMGQMSQMMETCNNMMKGMAQDHSPATPKKRSPGNKD